MTTHRRRPPPLPLLAPLFLAVSSGRADTLLVPEDHPTIQAGIDAAVDGDVVLVSPGTYFEHINLLGKAITVASADGPEVTTIDGSAAAGSVVTMTSGEGPTTVVEGFTVTGGTGSPDQFPYLTGGGFFLIDVAPTVRTCVIEINEADDGGGWYSRGGGPTVEACTFRENNAIGSAGARVLDGDLTILDSRFVRNCAFGSSGGGLTATSSRITITRTCFEANETTWCGGALSVSGELVLIDCDFVENVSTDDWCDGGAVGTSANTTIVGCRFIRNRSEGIAGALSVRSAATAHLTDCEFRDNTARQVGAVFCDHGGTMTLEQCAITGNTALFGAAVEAFESTLTMRDCTLIGNASGEWGGAISVFDATATIERCVLRGNAADQGAGIMSYGQTGSASTSILDCVLADNVAFWGAAVADFRGKALTVARSSFVNNVSAYDGGAIDGGADLRVTDCTFEANAAGRCGGAIRAFYDTTEIERCVFTANIAAEGGAVFARDGGTVTSSTFCRNEPDAIAGEYTDGGGNEFCCPADVDETGVVDLADVLAIVGAWGPCEGCPEDVDEDDVVGFSDVLGALAAWGPCP